VAESCAERQLLPVDARLVVGVSGGGDSMALLHVLLGLNRDFGYQLSLHIAHLNHALRAGESDDDAAFVQAAADDLGLPRTIETCDIIKLYEQEKGSLEEIARRERYVFYERVCVAGGMRMIALAHHADDNAETVLQRVLRGTGLHGMAGIVPSRVIRPHSDIQVVRPLLTFTRAEIRRYLEDDGIAYREDSTNQTLDTTRNRLRNALIPQIEAEYNPQVRVALLRLAEQARWASEYIRETSQKVFESLIISRTDQELVLNAQALGRKSRIVQTELVRAAIAMFEVGEQDLTFGHLKSIVDLVADDASNKQVTLPGGMTARSIYNRLVIAMPTEMPREMLAEQVAIHVPGKTVLPIRRMELNCEVRPVSVEDFAARQHNRNPYEEWLDFDNVRLPLVVRSRQSGDRFWPLGAPGSKKLGDFLSDVKVDPLERERVALVCDQLGPIWVIGHRIDERVKLTRISREALRIRARMLDE
jgi:tRNA(Ile)-lysidine synthase